MKPAICIVLLTGGLVCAWIYLVRPIRRCRGESVARSDDRPWRRVGAAICAVLGVMFPLGVYVMADRPSPKVYVAFWSVMMVLVLWLCALAVKDVAHTCKMVRSRRRGSADAGGGVRAYGRQGKGSDS